MSDTEKKIKQKMTRAEVCAFLRQVADILEGKNQPDVVVMDIDPEKPGKIKISIEDQQDGFFVKAKIKHREPDSPEAGDGKEKYKALKKRMKQEFKDIHESITENRFPAQNVVEAFIGDSGKMMEYPGKGNEYYPEYAMAVDGFASAWEARNISQMKMSLDVLNKVKDDCHARYK